MKLDRRSLFQFAGLKIGLFAVPWEKVWEGLRRLLRGREVHYVDIGGWNFQMGTLGFTLAVPPLLARRGSMAEIDRHLEAEAQRAAYALQHCVDQTRPIAEGALVVRVTMSREIANRTNPCFPGCLAALAKEHARTLLTG